MSAGTCTECACTETTACNHPEYGPCWWADETHELCSHCTGKLKNDTAVERFNDFNEIKLMSATKEHNHDEIEKGMRSSTNPPLVPPFSKGDEKKRKEHPILFSTPMVQANLENRKTQTRRVSKHQHWSHSELTDVNSNKIFQKVDRTVSCKYGKPGDLLWVRETTAFTKGPHQPYDTISYKADNFHRDINRPGIDFPEEEMCKEGWYDDCLSKELKWTPSIHVKKEYSRLWFEVLEIKVERIADISEEDAIAEGIEEYGPFGEYKGELHPGGGTMRYRAYSKASRAFQDLWQSINGKPKAIQSKIDGKLQTVGYIVSPFNEECAKPFKGLTTWRNKPLTVIVNPWVWVVKYKVLSTTGKPQNCYKTNDICKYDCKGLCKESV